MGNLALELKPTSQPGTQPDAAQIPNKETQLCKLIGWQQSIAKRLQATQQYILLTSGL
jgi:hypothetical protein